MEERPFNFSLDHTTPHHTAPQGMALEDPLAEDEMNDEEVPVTPRALATIRYLISVASPSSLPSIPSLPFLPPFDFVAASPPLHSITTH